MVKKWEGELGKKLKIKIKNNWRSNIDGMDILITAIRNTNKNGRNKRKGKSKMKTISKNKEEEKLKKGLKWLEHEKGRKWRQN